MWTISVFIFVVTIFISLELFVLLFNEDIDKYYVVISYCLLIPIIIACCFHYCYGRSRSYNQRFYLALGVILAAISVFLYYVYTINYFKFHYESDDITSGYGPAKYRTGSRDGYIYRKIIEFIIIELLLFYFICVAYKWQSLTDRA